jgi:hypothetical protein
MEDSAGVESIDRCKNCSNRSSTHAREINATTA